MSLFSVNTVSSGTGAGANEGALSEAQQLIAQLQAAFQGGNPALLQSVTQSALSLLDNLNAAHDVVSQSLGSGPMSASTASALSDKLDAIDQDATDLEAALETLGRGTMPAPVRNTSSTTGPASGNTLGLPSEEPEAAASSALGLSGSSDSAGSLPSGTKMLAMLAADPTILQSLKSLVKTSQQEAIMNAIANALQNGAGNSSNGNRNAAPNAKAVNTAVPTPVTQGATLQGGFTTVTGASGDAIPTVSSNISLTTGGAQSGNGNTASIDGWASNLGLSNPGDIDEFLMMVLLACYEDGQKGLEQMAQQLQKTNNAKKALRSQLSGLYSQTTGNPETDATVDAQIQNVQGQLSNASDDAQLQQLQLQNATENQQQLLQELSAFSKDLYDASMNILRKIGG